MAHRENQPTSGPQRARRIRVAVWLDHLANSYGLACADNNLKDCHADRENCKKKAGRYLGKKYDQCPIRELIEDERLLYVMQLEREASISKLSNWPDGYADWVVTLFGDLKAARSKRESSELESIRKTKVK